MKKTKNSAARLLKIIQKGKKIDKTTNCRSAWFELLGISNTDNPLLMERLGMVMRLPDQIVNELNQIENIEVDQYLQWKPIVRSI